MALQSTVASIQNIRKQRQLELELVELDRKWHVELKVIARERLALVKELCRINQEMQEVEHFRDTMRGKDLTRFADRAQGKLQHGREVKDMHKYSFQPDPVDKMNLRLPLIKEEMGEPDGGDIAQVVTAKDLYKHRVQLQKTNADQCTADRRSRRRPFWDKAVIESKRQKMPQDRNFFYRQQRAVGLLAHSVILQQPVDTDDGPSRPRGLSKSPSLPALNKLRRTDAFKANAVHPSLSKRHSVSMDYLPVIRTNKAHHGLFRAHKPGSISSVSSSVLPTIIEV